MIDNETYKRELIRMWDSIRDDEYKGTETCSGVTDCDECPLYNIGCGESLNAFEFIEAVEKWSKEHQKFTVSKLEYDILKSYIESLEGGYFVDHEPLMRLLERGYFKGATSKREVVDYYNNCEVKKDV